MSSIFDIDGYLEGLGGLPEHLRKNCTTMHDLGIKNKQVINDIDLASDEYLRKVKQLSPEKRKSEKEKIQKMFNLSKKYADEKVDIAVETYELVDKHIRELDVALAQLEENIRLKDSETDSSEEELPQEEVKKEKKKTTKKNKITKTPTHPIPVKSTKHGDQQKKKSDVDVKKKTTIKPETHSKNKPAKIEDIVKKKTKQKVEKYDGEVKKKNDEKKTNGKLEDDEKKSTKSASEEDAKWEELLKKHSKLEEKKGTDKVDNDKKRPKKTEESDLLNMAVDPNEPTYCFCRQVSFGDMIGCDNDECLIEWFHFECLGITVLPKGKWYCPDCMPMFKKKTTMKRSTYNSNL